MDNLEKLITTGKLKTYEITGGFINVFWEHKDIPKGGLLLFKFTQMQEKLVDIKTVYQRYLPVKYKPRVYSSRMIALVTSPQMALVCHVLATASIY